MRTITIHTSINDCAIDQRTTHPCHSIRRATYNALMKRGSHTSSMNRLIGQLSRLPGIGKRSAERLAFHLLKQSSRDVLELSRAIADLKKHTKQCSICFNLTDVDPCPICTDPQRDRGLVLVVEQPSDVLSMESTGLYQGVYHVLLGRLSPLDGIGPGDLTIGALLERVRRGNAGRGEAAVSSGASAEGEADAQAMDGAKPQAAIHEVIIGTNANIESDGTALHLMQELGTLQVKVSRLARGLPYGQNVEMVSKAVLADAIQGRQAVQ